MGMFDEIVVEDESLFHSTSNPGTDHMFQTKSLDCTLTVYTITKDRKLLGSAGTPLEYHGDIYFYHPGDWIARFNHGTLLWIKDKDAPDPQYVHSTSNLEELARIGEQFVEWARDGDRKMEAWHEGVRLAKEYVNIHG